MLPISFKFGTNMMQEFSIPLSYVNFIRERPSSPDLWEKLIQTCKFFFEHTPRVAIGDLEIEKGGEIVATKYNERCKVENIKNIQFWLCDGLVIKKQLRFGDLYIYKCDIAYLHLCQVNLKLEELKLIGKMVKTFASINAGIFGEDGSIALLDQVIEYLPQTNDISFTGCSTCVAKETVPKLLGQFKSYSNIALTDVDEKFCFATFSKFMKDNPSIKYSLIFSTNLGNDLKMEISGFMETIQCDSTRRSRILISLPFDFHGETFYQNLEYPEAGDDESYASHGLSSGDGNMSIDIFSNISSSELSSCFSGDDDESLSSSNSDVISSNNSCFENSFEL